MKMDKTTKIVLISTGSAILIASVIAIIVGLKSKNDGEGQTIDMGEEGEKDEVKKVPSAIFPMKKGDIAKEMINVRMGLGLAPSYKFDEEVETALYNRFKVKQITRSDYYGMVSLFKSLGVDIK